MKNKFSILIFFLLLYSCKPVIKTVYGVNKNIEFTSLKSYGDFVSEKYKIDVSNFYYLDKTSYHDFMYMIVGSKVDYYLGTYINDSTKVVKSDFLLENESCVSRVLKEINYSVKEADEFTTTEDKTFKAHSFYNVATGKPLEFSNDGKVKIVIVYSYKMGSIRKTDFIEIQKKINLTPTHDLIIISMDDVSGLKKE